LRKVLTAVHHQFFERLLQAVLVRDGEDGEGVGERQPGVHGLDTSETKNYE
jgi:hypothetical protein